MVVVGNGFIILTLSMLDNTANVVGFNIFWIKLQSAGVIDNSAVKVALAYLASRVVVGGG